ncbi:MAG: superoxide dismutase family protein [Deltaproteobacteria bacterium]|nr:superoxide dismutase family protein [Deltaproteobacteria bacterium]
MHRFILLAVAISVAACSKTPTTATATFEPKSGTQVTGTATFDEAEGSTTITISAKALTPGKKHAIAVHEKGDCTGSNAAAVGHRLQPGGDHDAGLLGEITPGADGMGTLKVSSTKLTVKPGDASVIGKSIVISSDPPNPGSLVTFGIISCGVIEAAK